MATVQSIVRALNILQEFTPETPILGVSELSRKLNMERSAVQRAVVSLMEGGLLDQEPVSGKYTLGLGLLELSGIMLQGRYYSGAVRPFLRELADIAGESVYLGVLFNSDSIIQIDDVASPHLVQYPGWVGRRLPLYCTASGKIVLANFPNEEINNYIKNTKLESFTPKSITNPDVLLQDLALSKERGYATDDGEYNDGIIAISAAVPTPDGGTNAVVTILGPKYRFPMKKAIESSDALLAIAGKIPVRPFLFMFD